MADPKAPTHELMRRTLAGRAVLPLTPLDVERLTAYIAAAEQTEREREETEERFCELAAGAVNLQVAYEYFERLKKERDELKAKLSESERLAAVLREHGPTLREACQFAEGCTENTEADMARFGAAAKAVGEAIK